MTIEVSQLLLIIWLHFISDFILQPTFLSENKSNNNYILLIHVAIYLIPFILIGWIFAIINGVLHFIIDWFSSRICKFFFIKKKLHLFFITIGLDQVIHISILILTYKIYIG